LNDVQRGTVAKRRGAGRRVALALAAAGVALVLVSCGPPPAMLRPLFPNAVDVANGPRLYVGHARRVPPPPPREAEPEGAKVPERPDSLAILETLPRGDEGQVNWVQALADKLIEPKPGVALDAKDEDPTDMDVELVPKGQPEFKVVFSHKVHTSWMGCPACHTGLFEMEKGKTAITMDKINAGTSCGACHGKVAAPEPMTCPACHKTMG
jgi:c(7)-type cytochrome triheme protein